jgi:phospholipase/lecithinase/hemolysin
MALLDDTNRYRTWAQYLRSSLGSVSGVTKADVRAAVDATDAWIESAQAAVAPATGFNSALPQPFRGAASSDQKTLLFCYVAMRRAGLLKTEAD